MTSTSQAVLRTNASVASLCTLQRRLDDQLWRVLWRSKLVYTMGTLKRFAHEINILHHNKYGAYIQLEDDIVLASSRLLRRALNQAVTMLKDSVLGMIMLFESDSSVKKHSFIEEAKFLLVPEQSLFRKRDDPWLVGYYGFILKTKDLLPLAEYCQSLLTGISIMSLLTGMFRISSSAKNGFSDCRAYRESLFKRRFNTDLSSPAPSRTSLSVLAAT